MVRRRRSVKCAPEYGELESRSNPRLERTDHYEGKELAEVVEAQGRIGRGAARRPDVRGQQAQPALEGPSGLSFGAG